MLDLVLTEARGRRHRDGLLLTGLEILDTARAYEPLAEDYFLLGIGVAYARRTVSQSLRSRGAKFVTLVHPRALVAESSQIGEGSIVCPGAIVSDSATLGECVL
ncbi:MAG: hypothetical protein ACOYM9_24780, partial [Bradymonadia bacterium]